MTLNNSKRVLYKMKLRFKTKKPLHVTDIIKKIGSDADVYYEINDVLGITFGKEIEYSDD